VLIIIVILLPFIAMSAADKELEGCVDSHNLWPRGLPTNPSENPPSTSAGTKNAPILPTSSGSGGTSHWLSFLADSSDDDEEEHSFTSITQKIIKSKDSETVVVPSELADDDSSSECTEKTASGKNGANNSNNKSNNSSQRMIDKLGAQVQQLKRELFYKESSLKHQMGRVKHEKEHGKQREKIFQISKYSAAT
jgi:hypothetical protein